MNHPHDQVILLTDCLKKMDKAEAISFDIFDTLLIRRVANPHDLFWFIEPTAREAFNDTMLDFYTLRMQAERDARDEAYRQGREEVTLDEIYRFIQQELHYADAKAIERVKHKELEVEEAHCVPHQAIHPLFEYAVKQDKPVVIASDMYLPEQFIKQLLAKHELTGYDKLFLSSSVVKTKHKGSLYQEIISYLGVKPNKILHIGDNLHADIRQAKRAGLSVYHVAKPIDNFFDHDYADTVWDKKRKVDSPELSIILGAMAAKSALKRAEDESFNPPTTDWEHFGYYIVGPIYLGFITWLLETTKAAGIKQLLFLARDGKIMKQLFEFLQPIYNNHCECKYLLVSRRALQIPRLKDGLDNTGLDYLTITDPSHPQTVGNYMERNQLGLTEADYLPVIQEHGFKSPEDMVRTKQDVKRLRACFIALKEPIMKKAQEEYDAFQAHLKEEGVTADGTKKAIVDVGWHGSMLYALRDMLPTEEQPLSAFFFGTMQRINDVRRAGFPVYSYMVDGHHPYYFAETLTTCIEIVELLFTAPCGSVIHLEKTENGVEPVLDKTENHPRRLQAVRELQEGALQFINDVKPMLETRPLHAFRKEEMILPLKILLENPLPEEAAMFDDIVHIQNIGKQDLTRAIAPKPNLKWLYFKPNQFAQQYKSSYWRKGFEARMDGLSRRYFKLLANTALSAKRVKHTLTRRKDSA